MLYHLTIHRKSPKGPSRLRLTSRQHTGNPMEVLFRIQMPIKDRPPSVGSKGLTIGKLWHTEYRLNLQVDSTAKQVSPLRPLNAPSFSLNSVISHCLRIVGRRVSLTRDAKHLQKASPCRERFLKGQTRPARARHSDLTIPNTDAGCFRLALPASHPLH